MSPERRPSGGAGLGPAAGPAPLFAALGDETRLHLVDRLSAEGPLSITRLTADSSVTRQAVTKHLRVLAEAGLTRSTHVGRETIWELEPRPLQAAGQYLDEISAQWDAALSRLQALVEKGPEDPRSTP
jgi:DNA-binding transcriptional ArsR family regulator